MSGKLIIINPPGVPNTEVEYTGKRPELKQLQSAVGGLIERVKVRFDGRVREAYANEDGFSLSLPINFEASRLVSEFGYGGIVGPLVIILPTPKVKS